MVDDIDVDVEPEAQPKRRRKTKNPRDTARFWQRWIAAAKKAPQRHWNDSRRAWREYDGDVERGASRATDRSYDDNWQGVGERYPIYWSRMKLMESAFYSRRPETFARRNFGANDEVALTMALIVDRTGKYLLETSGFDAAMKAAVQDLLNADKTTVQVDYCYAEKPTKKRFAATPGEMGDEYLDAETSEAVEEEIKQDDDGLFYEREVDEISDQTISVRPVVYDEIIHTPTAKMPEEIQDMAYHFCLTKSEAVERFGEEKVATWPDTVWHATREYDRDRREIQTDDLTMPEKVIEGWEIWSIVTKKVYWFCPDMKGDFLDVQDDPYKLRGFFPSPRFVIGTKPAKSLYPTPPFVRIWPTLMALHQMYGRVFKLIDAVRRRALVDNNDGLVDLLENLGETEFVAVQNMRELVEKGGLDNMVLYLPVQELVQAIGELNQQDDKFKANIDEWLGTPDILRGSGDPIETATAQEVKVSAAHDRFRTLKGAVAEMARETLEIMIDLALNVFTDEKFQAVTGFKYMDQEDQQRFLPALDALRNDTERVVRIEIDTDTTSYVGEQIRQQQVAAVVTTLTKGLESVANMAQQSPGMGQLAIKIMMESLSSLPGGPQFMDEVRSAMQEQLEAMQQPQEQQPDYEGMKLQIEQQKAMTAQQKVDVEGMKAQMSAQIEQMTLQIKQQAEMFRLSLQQQKQEFEQAIQGSYLEIDAQKASVEMGNKQADNERLNVEAQAKVIEAAKPNPKTEGAVNIVTINAPSEVPELPKAIAEILK